MANETSADDMPKCINKTFPNIYFVVWKLASIGENDSFKLGV